MSGPTPQQLAAFDQAHAEALEYIATVRRAYVEELAVQPSRPVALASLAETLVQLGTLHGLAQLLAVLIDRDAR